MKYNPEWYQRKKLGLVKKSEDFEAFKQIRERWGFDDAKIRRLLLTHTKTEIIFGDIDSGEFRPKELINLKGLLAALLALVSLLLHSHSFATPSPEIASVISNYQDIGSILSK